MLPTQVPTAYHVVYRAEDIAGGHRIVTTERVWQRRPFDSRTEVLAGPPPGGQQQALTVASLGRLLSRSGDASPAILNVPPAPGIGDLRADTAITDLLAKHAIVARNRRTVAGRSCQVFRAGGPPAAGVLEPYKAGSSSFTEFCLDRDGIVLETVTTSKGAVVRREVAVSAVTDPRDALPDTLFDTSGSAPPADQGGGSVRPVDPNSKPPGTWWELDAPPDGFTQRGRFAVVPPQPENFTDPTRFAARQAGVVDVFVRGPDMLVVDRGGTAGGVAPFAPEPSARPVDLGALGRGDLIVGLAFNEVRIAFRNGHYVRLIGTVPADVLVATARQMHEVPGGALVYLDHP